MHSDPIIAAIDAGGTSFKCALVRDDGTLLSHWRVPTTSPEATLSACAEAFQSQIDHMNVAPAALGIASFGPVDIDPKSPNYGSIMGTAKPGWNGAAIGAALASALDLPVFVETDVNAALAAEMRWGAAKHVASAAYMTVGTGIGVGLYVNSGLAGRPSHPEFGHIRVERHPEDLAFEGVCAIHGDCLEGLASARAFEARWGDPRELPADHRGWTIEAHYLAQACLTLYLTTRLERIVLGGGLLQSAHLFPHTRTAFDALLGNYLSVSSVDLICPPGLGEHAGVLGGAVIALNGLN